MSLAEEMLASISVDDGIQTYSEIEEHIVVNDMRQIIVPNSLKTIAVTGDKDIETVTFDCVRYWDGNDLSTFAIYLNYVLPDMSSGTYIPEEIVTSDGDEFYHFDWKIKNNITQKSGKISFAITAIKTRKEQNGAIFVDKQWSSIPNSDCSIALGLNISNVPSEEESEDILAQMSAILEDLQSNLTELVYSNVVQSTGYDTTKVMSQAAVTLEFEKTNQRIEKNDKRITNIEKGMMAESFETDDSVAYIKDVPTNALPYAAISKIGGMTYKEGNVLRSAPVTEVKSVGANMATLVNGNHNLDDRIDLTVNNGHIEISTAVYEDFRYDKWKPYTTLFLKAGTYNFSLQNRSLSHNENVAFTVMILDLNTGDDIAELLFNLNQSDNTDFVIDKDKEVYIATYVFNSTGQTVSCSFDLMISKGSGRKDFIKPIVHTLPIPAEVQALDGYGEGNPDNIGEHNYIDFDRKRFCSYGHIVSGAWTGYHTMQETDISDILSSDNLIGVEGGGDITMVNEHEYAVPSEIIYQVKGE